MGAFARAGLVGGLLAAAWAVPASAQSPAEAAATDPAAVADDVVVARVGAEAIMLSEVIGQIYAMSEEERGKYAFDEIYRETLQRRIDRELVYLAARDNGIGEDPDYLARMRILERRVMSDTYMQRELARRVSEQEIQGRYDRMAAAQVDRTELWARHIMAGDEAAARALKSQLAAGADFAEVARGLDYPGASVGGDLGYFTEDNMAPEIVAVARTLEVGAVSEPFETPYGWLLIKLEGERPVALRAFAEVRQQLYEELSRDAITTVLDELRAATPVARFNRDGTPLEEPAAETD